MISTERYSISKKKFFIVAFLALILSLAIGVIIGYFSAPSKTPNNTNDGSYYESLIEDSKESFIDEILQEIKADNIKEHLKRMTSYAHIAGESGDYRSAKYVYDNWIKQALDYVKIIDYDVLLSYPLANRPNNYQILASNGQLEQSVDITETIHDQNLNYSGTPYPFLAYSPNGTVRADRVYFANYGTDEDFKYLIQLGYNLNDSIALIKYGRVFRGDKVLTAQKYGIKGVLLYSDPQRVAPLGLKELYPNGEFLPEDGTQRGTIYIGNGDPLTPLYPSTEYAYREDELKNTELPRIVAQVIGYRDAKIIFELLKINVPCSDSDWIGTMDVTYTYGGPLVNSKSLVINVFNEKRVKKTYNVIGMIKGVTEPDQYVLMGNHRDAWVLGSIDPTSGTAAILEVSRVLANLKLKSNWKPKRSILFLSWGAEEYGLIGSTEWVEEFNKKLSVNSIAYLNMDIAVQGNYSITIDSSPLLHELIYDVTKKIPFNNEESVYDRWLKYEATEDGSKPEIFTALGSGSDFMGFQQRIGIPSMDARINHDYSEKYKYLSSSYALYHSSYETFRLVDEFIDPGFKSFAIVSSVMSELARRLADSIKLPFKCGDYVEELYRNFNDFSDDYGLQLSQQNISLNSTLLKTIKNFEGACERFQQKFDSIDITKVLQIRKMNDQLKHLEKSFLDPRGLSRMGYMHLISAPSINNQYGGDSFPALSDASFNAVNNSIFENWEQVKFELSLVIYVINSAINILADPSDFSQY